MKTPVSLRLDLDLLARIDEARGLVPRAAWISRALERELVKPDPENRPFGVWGPAVPDVPGAKHQQGGNDATLRSRSAAFQRATQR